MNQEIKKELDGIISGEITIKLYNYRQAKKLLNIAQSTLDKYIGRGYLKTIAVGYAKRISAAEIARFIKQKQSQCNTKEAAIMLGISPSLLRRLIKKGDIKANKVSKRRIIIQKDEIERFAREGALSFDNTAKN